MYAGFRFIIDDAGPTFLPLLLLLLLHLLPMLSTCLSRPFTEEAHRLHSHPTGQLPYETTISIPPNSNLIPEAFL